MIMIEVVLTILHVIKVKAIKWYKNWHWHWQRNCDGSRNRNKKGTVNGIGNGSG